MSRDVVHVPTANLRSVVRRMSSIASAPGWKARFLPENEIEEPRTVTLVAWALVEDSDGRTEVVGVVQRAATAEAPSGSLSFADEIEGFRGYAFTGLAIHSPSD